MVFALFGKSAFFVTCSAFFVTSLWCFLGGGGVTVESGYKDTVIHQHLCLEAVQTCANQI